MKPTKFDEHAVAQRAAEEAEFGPCKRIDDMTIRMHPNLKETIVALSVYEGVSANVFVRRLLLAEYQRRKAQEEAS